jgi:2'-5' RNA ligase
VGTKRLFVSLEFPATVAAILADLDPGMRGVRWVRAEQVHLTLAFLGNVEAEVQSNLQNQLKTIQFTHFFTPLQGIGVFPARDRPKIVWVGVGQGHPHLFQLHKKIADAALAAGIEPDLRPWHPHITLARCQDVSGQALQPFLRRHADLDLGVFSIEEFHLKSSRLTPAGSIYTTEFTVAAS